MRIAYVTPYYNGSCDGRYGRFLDWVHTARDVDNPPFEFDVYAFTASNPDGTLASTAHGYLGDAESLWGTKKNKPEFLLNAPRIGRALRENEYDLVHVVPMDTIVYPTVLAAAPDVPVVVGPNIGGWSPVRDVPHWDEGTADYVENRLRFGLKNALARLGEFDHAVAFSEHHRDMLESFSIERPDTTVLEAGVDLRFTPGEDDTIGEPPELLYVGDFSHHKGYYQFLDAISRLDVPVTARLLGAGDPDRRRISELGLEETVTVEGFVPRSELPEYYRRGDLLVVPTIDETAGTNAQIEALACGTPVVLTDKPGVNEFAPAGASVAYSPRGVPRLVEALETALVDLESMTEIARREAPNYRATGTLEQLFDLYQTLLAESDDGRAQR
ncbi:glycosyltransferase family 4 protein [Halomicrobium urmianum]|uniref:glycosyltransferase family 4 protein n=1 Tax=Halomicrobium urmianum TaxID=1586233 RepID=UPI001CD9F9F0|nr:glycosyltransferase family 4 protein [Halomicrobium urmianum]